jgi:hypothetical protein
MLWRQGDIFIETIKFIADLPGRTKLPHGTIVHGEVTGHRHRVEDPATADLYTGSNPAEFFLEVKAPRALIVHEEHGTIELERGFYRIWRQREYAPEAIRIVVD